VISEDEPVRVDPGAVQPLLDRGEEARVAERARREIDVEPHAVARLAVRGDQLDRLAGHPRVDPADHPEALGDVEERGGRDHVAVDARMRISSSFHVHCTEVSLLSQ